MLTNIFTSARLYKTRIRAEQPSINHRREGTGEGEEDVQKRDYGGLDWDYEESDV